MELNAYELHTASFTPPDNNSLVTATVSVNGDTPVSTVVTVDGTTRSINLPYVDGDGEVEVVWSFTVNGNSYTRSTSYEYVTPYLTIAEVKAMFPAFSDEEAANVEAAARLVINAHTGQSFGYSPNQTLEILGHGEEALRLPRHLLSISGMSTLNDSLDTRGIIIDGNGWSLRKKWLDSIGSLTTDNQYWGSNEQGGVIYAPPEDDGPTTWTYDYPFRITGDWGYKSIPAGVHEAARLLANDYGCIESRYRDSYLQSIKAADWRMQFSSRAWEFTGNVRADQLLSEFVMFDWVVI